MIPMFSRCRPHSSFASTRPLQPTPVMNSMSRSMASGRKVIRLPEIRQEEGRNQVFAELGITHRQFQELLFDLTDEAHKALSQHDKITPPTIREVLSVHYKQAILYDDVDVGEVGALTITNKKTNESFTLSEYEVPRIAKIRQICKVLESASKKG